MTRLLFHPEMHHTATVQHGPKGGRYVLTPSGKHYLGAK